MVDSCKRLAYSIITNSLWLALTLLDGLLYLVFLPLQSLRACRWALGRPSDPKQVVVVGAGFGGLEAVKILNKDPRFDVTLVSRRDHFEYTPGILRLFCEPELFWEMSAHIPKGRNELVLGDVTKVDKNSCVVETRGGTQVIPFDYLILAMGADYRKPITASTSDVTMEERAATWDREAAAVQQANSVIVIGGGAVGAELAAEIVEYYPEKQVTVMTNANALVPSFPPQSQARARRWFETRGTRLIFNTYVDVDPVDKTKCKTKSGETFTADLIFNCIGLKAHTSSVEKGSIASSLTGEKKLLEARDTMQLKGYDHIFAIGDMMVLQSKEIKQAFFAAQHGKVAARNIAKHLSRKPLWEYPDDLVRNWKAPLVAIVSLGKYTGSLVFNEFVLDGFIAAIVKWFIEWTQVAMLQHRPVGLFTWWVGDNVAFLMSRCCCKPKKDSSDRGEKGGSRALLCFADESDSEV
mmetsp:Transcript_8249/g.19402  ORF Transcript_8249/g.19402 Transcript_8249/m.19402 type:complete len:466 (-) Transcript_8249:97-1494(-)